MRVACTCETCVLGQHGFCHAAVRRGERQRARRGHEWRLQETACASPSRSGQSIGGWAREEAAVCSKLGACSSLAGRPGGPSRNGCGDRNHPGMHRPQGRSLELPPVPPLLLPPLLSPLLEAASNLSLELLAGAADPHLPLHRFRGAPQLAGYHTLAAHHAMVSGRRCVPAGVRLPAHGLPWPATVVRQDLSGCTLIAHDGSSRAFASYHPPGTSTKPASGRWTTHRCLPGLSGRSATRPHGSTQPCWCVCARGSSLCCAALQCTVRKHFKLPVPPQPLLVMLVLPCLLKL